MVDRDFGLRVRSLSSLVLIVLLGLAPGCELACGTSRAPFTAPDATTADRPNSPTYRLSGTVVEFGAGPVVQATISALSCSGSPSYNHLFAETQTDGNGAFRLTAESGNALPISCVYLRTNKDGYVTTDLNPRGAHDGITINLQRLRGVTGRVVEPESSPVAGVTIGVS